MWDAIQEILQGPKHIGVNCGKAHKKIAKHPWKHQTYLVMQISDSKYFSYKSSLFYCFVQNSHKKK